jgi:hypothetical protein
METTKRQIDKEKDKTKTKPKETNKPHTTQTTKPLPKIQNIHITPRKRKEQDKVTEAHRGTKFTYLLVTCVKVLGVGVFLEGESVYIVRCSRFYKKSPLAREGVLFTIGKVFCFHWLVNN